MEKDFLNKKYRLLVIGGSAGSLEVIFYLLSRLHPAFSLSIVIVVHRKGHAGSQLVDLLASKTSLPVKEAHNKETIRPAAVYLAPADYHLQVEKGGILSLDCSEKVNYSRPGIDVTFQTAAAAFGPSLACLLLSGANEDGAAGLKKVKELGGLTLVQDPSTAEMAYMPRKAIETVAVDRILNIEEMPGAVNELDQ